jgi:hypothetical protein
LRVTGQAGIRRDRRRNPSGTNIERTRMEFLKELLSFLRARKKLWLLPIIILVVVMGGLLIVAQGSVFAPFIYTLF